MSVAEQAALSGTMQSVTGTRLPSTCAVRAGALLVLLATLGCVPPQANTPTLTNEVYDVSLAGVDPNAKQVVHTVQVRGEERRFGLWVPPEGVTQGHPVILFLHGAQRHPVFEHMGGCFIEPELAQLKPIVVAPHAPLGQGGEWWRGEEASYALGLLKAVITSWPVDDRKVVVMGYSNGGIGAWVFARAYPQYFSAAVPMAFNHTVMGETPLPVFALQGGQDELFGSREIEARAQELQQQGQDLRLVVRPRTTHMMGCKFQPELAQVREWLQAEVWAGLSGAAGNGHVP